MKSLLAGLVFASGLLAQTGDPAIQSARWTDRKLPYRLYFHSPR
jgi:hypothetical protein